MPYLYAQLFINLAKKRTSKLEVDPPEYRQEKKKFKARKNKKTF